MRRRLTTIFACVMVLLSLTISGTVQANPLIAISFPPFFPTEAVDGSADLLQKFETEILPQFENVLTPEQRDQFKTSVADGTSFRKAFKALTLTPEQKAQVGALLKTLPKKDFFASLTPEQKQQLFLKKKGLVKPTPEEIGEKISAKMQLVKDKSPFAPTGADISEKISAKMKLAKEKLEAATP